MENKTESSMIITNKLVPEIEVLFNMIKKQQSQITLMQNQLEEQSKLIVSLQRMQGRLTPKEVDIPFGRPKVDIKAEVDMLLSDDWLSDSGIKTTSDSDYSIDDLLELIPNRPKVHIEDCKEETVLQEEKTGFVQKNVLPRKTNHHPILTTGPIRIIQYSEKAFVVIGDTKKYNTKLKSMGGKWNPSLTYKETGEKFMGWVFSNTKKDKIRTWIETGCL